MYGYSSNLSAGNDANLINNEIVFTNLINIANNPVIFRSLDKNTQQQLVEVLCAYTKVCIKSIRTSHSPEADQINMINRK